MKECKAKRKEMKNLHGHLPEYHLGRAVRILKIKEV